MGDKSNRDGGVKSPSGSQPISLSEEEEKIGLARPGLKEVVTTRVLRLFQISLGATLVFATGLVILDAWMLASALIKPEQRLITESILTKLITATVVQVGAAFAAIVFSVFRYPNDKDTGNGSNS